MGTAQGCHIQTVYISSCRRKSNVLDVFSQELNWEKNGISTLTQGALGAFNPHIGYWLTVRSLFSIILNTKIPCGGNQRRLQGSSWQWCFMVGSRGQMSQLGLVQEETGVTVPGWVCCWWRKRWRSWRWRKLVGNDNISRHLPSGVLATTSLVMSQRSRCESLCWLLELLKFRFALSICLTVCRALLSHYVKCNCIPPTLEPRVYWVLELWDAFSPVSTLSGALRLSWAAL